MVKRGKRILTYKGAHKTFKELQRESELIAQFNSEQEQEIRSLKRKLGRLIREREARLSESIELQRENKELTKQVLIDKEILAKRIIGMFNFEDNL